MIAPARRWRTLRTSAAALAVLSVVTALLLAVMPPAPAAAAAGDLCERFAASATVGGRYTVQNNRWGTEARQCVQAVGDGFEVVAAEGVVGPGAPKSYPSIVAGCHWGRCTAGSGLPLATSQLEGVRTAVSIERAPGVWNAAYDLWLNSSPVTGGENDDTEIMIWIDHQGFAQPIGVVIGQVSIGGASWTIWQGKAATDVVTFVRDVGATSVDLALAPFVAEAIERGATQEGSYLTSVQFGFEPWSGGQGLAARGFSFTTGDAVVAEPTGVGGGDGQGAPGAPGSERLEEASATAPVSRPPGGSGGGDAPAGDAPLPAGAPTSDPEGGVGEDGAPPVPPARQDVSTDAAGSGAPLISARTGQCLEAGAAQQGGVVRLGVCDGGQDQGWSARGQHLVNAGSGACLSAPGASVGAAVVTWTCYDGDATEQWQANDQGQLVNLAAGACLDADPAGGEHGAAMMLRDCPPARP